jgi:hypothetical protein
LSFSKSSIRASPFLWLPPPAISSWVTAAWWL